jgi:hypothetical protein
MSVVTCIEQVETEILLKLARVDLHSELFEETTLDGLFGSRKEPSIIR